jgi:hypothetical protein
MGSMKTELRVDRWFVFRVTLWIGCPISLLYGWAYVYGGDREKLPFVVGLILATFLISFVLAFGTWYFFVRPNQCVDQPFHRQPSRETESAVGEAIEYVADYEESDTRISERQFVWRGLRKLWLLESLLGPIAGCLVLVVGYAVGAGNGFLVAFGALTCFLLISPAILLILRPALAASGTKRVPTEVISFRPHGLVIRGGASERLYAWHRIRNLWDVGPHYLLVADRYLGIHLPKKGLPREALPYVQAHANLPDAEAKRVSR